MANNQNQGFVSALKKYGVMKSDGQNMSDLLPAPAQQGTTVSNDMDTWVRSLPQGLTDAALNTYIYSNPDFKNNDTRKSAYEWYHQINGGGANLPAPSGDIYQQMFDAGVADEYNAMRWLQSNGYNYSDAKGPAGVYMGLYGNGSFGNDVPSKLVDTINSEVKDYNSAVNYMRNNGFTQTPLTQDQWAMTSQKSRFATYKDYLKAFAYEYMNR